MKTPKDPVANMLKQLENMQYEKAIGYTDAIEAVQRAVLGGLDRSPAKCTEYQRLAYEIAEKAIWAGTQVIPPRWVTPTTQGCRKTP